MSRLKIKIYKTPIAKIVLLGDAAVGKTTLRNIYLGKGYETVYMPTIGADVGTKKIEIGGKTFEFQIWDLAGQPHFTAVRTLYYGGTTGAILMYDVSRAETLANLKNWTKELYDHSNMRIVALSVVGNKTDLRKTEFKTITTQQGLEFVEGLMKERGSITWINFLETSLKDNPNADVVFQTFAEAVFKDKQ
ncbi:MAG: GTP-binding protein [Candidatus Hermodarchaeota archaeon]